MVIFDALQIHLKKS